jgi:uncharacterized membrane protein
MVLGKKMSHYCGRTRKAELAHFGAPYAMMGGVFLSSGVIVTLFIYLVSICLVMYEYFHSK